MSAIGHLAGTPWAKACVRVLSEGMTGDATGVYLVSSTVLQVSPPAFPTVIREAVQKAKAARVALGPWLGDVIIDPLDEWEMNGVTCALFEQLSPIPAGRFKRLLELNRVTPHVLGWLRQVAAVSREQNTATEACLRGLKSSPYDFLREAAGQALSTLSEGNFRPRATVMHGDFWTGNILLDPAGSRDFVVIDWRGCVVEGHAIFDLIKFAESAGLGPRLLHRELSEHARVLDCTLAETRIYLLAALGHIWLNLDQFPPDRFAAMARRNLQTLDRALHA